MVKIQVNSQGKAYFTSGNKVLVASGGADVVTATNTTGSTVSEGDKVWINHDNNGYKLVSPYGDLQNFSINGSPTIVNKAATNFSLSNYLISNTNNNTFSPGNNPWELVLKFKYNADIDLTQSPPFYFWLKPNTRRYGLAIGTTFTDNKIRMWLMMSTNGSSWTSWNGWNSDYYGWDEFVFEKDTVYWIRISWTGSEYRLEYSTDGVNFALGSTYTDYNPIGGSYPLSEIHIGEYYNIDSGQGMTVYLDGCYGKINGVTTWAPYFPNIDENSQTGIAAESIANGSSGAVNTVLGE